MRLCSTWESRGSADQLEGQGRQQGDEAHARQAGELAKQAVPIHEDLGEEEEHQQRGEEGEAGG